MTRNIIFVYVSGGAPLEHALPRVAKYGTLHLLAVAPLPMATRHLWESLCHTVADLSSLSLRGEDLVDAVANYAKQMSADAVLCLSEYAVVAVAEAALRLGLRGAGANVRRARDKRQMRQTWRDAGVPVPAFRTVHRPEEVFSAMRELRPPLLLKSAWGAGSVGQMVLTTTEDIVPAWTGHQLAVADDIRDGFSELYVNDADAQVLVEEIVVGSTEGWYDEPGYGDYLSVEGLVAGGVYHPLCITSRLPTVPPFTEVSNNAPCVLPEHLQRKIEGVARRAVDALGLDTCGTHTEIKLAAAGELFVIESAARFGGCMVTREVETVFGFDPIGALCQELLGDPVIYPEQMWTTGSGAAASLALIAIDASGRPWSRPRVWSPENVAWSNLLSDQTRLEIIPGLSIASGSHIPPYNSGAGAGNWAGIFFLTSDTPQSLLADCHTVLNGMEHQLVAVAPQNKGE